MKPTYTPFSETADDTVEFAIFRPGTYHDGQSVWTEEDCNEVIDNYDPNWMSAPNVIGHAAERGPQDPAYGRAESLFWRGGEVWARVKKMPEEFKEWVRKGFWTERSVELFRNFKGTGKKYLGAITWQGAHRPEVAGLPAAVFADDLGESEEISFEERKASFKEKALATLASLFDQFQDEEADPGTIVKEMNREDATGELDQIWWKFRDKLMDIEFNRDLSSDDKRAQSDALLNELVGLVQQTGAKISTNFAERSDDMSGNNDKGVITMSPEQFQEAINKAVTGAVNQVQENFEAKVDEKVQEGLKDIAGEARRTNVQQFCELLKSKGVQPALIDDTGLAAVLCELNIHEKHSFSEGAEAVSVATQVQNILTAFAEAAADGGLLVDYAERGAPKKKAVTGADPDEDREAWAKEEFEEKKETYRAMGITDHKALMHDIVTSKDRPKMPKSETAAA